MLDSNNISGTLSTKLHLLSTLLAWSVKPSAVLDKPTLHCSCSVQCSDNCAQYTAYSTLTVTYRTLTVWLKEIRQQSDFGQF